MTQFWKAPDISSGAESVGSAYMHVKVMHTNELHDVILEEILHERNFPLYVQI